MSTPADSAAAQLRLCQLQERRLQRQLDSSESVLAQQQERLQMCGEQVAEVEKSGAADMIDQLDQLNAQEETLDSDIRRTQDTIMDLRRRLHDARMSTIAATTASQHHEAASTGSSLTPSSEGEKLRADPVKVDTQALGFLVSPWFYYPRGGGFANPGYLLIPRGRDCSGTPPLTKSRHLSASGVLHRPRTDCEYLQFPCRVGGRISKT